MSLFKQADRPAAGEGPVVNTDLEIASLGRMQKNNSNREEPLDLTNQTIKATELDQLIQNTLRKKDIEAYQKIVGPDGDKEEGSYDRFVKYAEQHGTIKLRNALALLGKYTEKYEAAFTFANPDELENKDTILKYMMKPELGVKISVRTIKQKDEDSGNMVNTVVAGTMWSIMPDSVVYKGQTIDTTFEGKKIGAVQYAWTSPNVRGAGLGRSMIDDIYKLAEKNNVGVMYAEIDDKHIMRPREVYAQSLDTRGLVDKRNRYWRYNGVKQMDIQYEQPSLGEGMYPVVALQPSIVFIGGKPRTEVPPELPKKIFLGYFFSFVKNLDKDPSVERLMTAIDARQGKPVPLLELGEKRSCLTEEIARRDQIAKEKAASQGTKVDAMKSVDAVLEAKPSDTDAMASAYKAVQRRKFEGVSQETAYGMVVNQAAMKYTKNQDIIAGVHDLMRSNPAQSSLATWCGCVRMEVPENPSYTEWVMKTPPTFTLKTREARWEKDREGTIRLTKGRIEAAKSLLSDLVGELKTAESSHDQLIAATKIVSMYSWDTPISGRARMGGAVQNAITAATEYLMEKAASLPPGERLDKNSEMALATLYGHWEKQANASPEQVAHWIKGGIPEWMKFQLYQFAEDPQKELLASQVKAGQSTGSQALDAYLKKEIAAA